jgi:hypothetical protein
MNPTKAQASALTPEELRYRDDASAAYAPAAVLEATHVEHVIADDDPANIVKGVVQPPAYRDVPFAILFLVHVLGMAGTALTLGAHFVQNMAHTDDNEGSNNNNNNNADEDNDSSQSSNRSGENLLLILTCIFVVAGAATTGALRLMMLYPTRMVQVAFWAAPVMFGAVALLFSVASLGNSDDTNNDGIYQLFWMLAAASACLSLCLYKCYARFIPFASTTLKTALTAIRGHFGLYLIEYALLLVLYAYTVLWFFAFAGVVYHDNEQGQVPCQQKYPDDPQYTSAYEMCDNAPLSLPVVGLFLLCLFWTQQVVQNIVHVTTAGTVGSWWFASALQDPSCCGRDVLDSFHRAMTYSLGSICFGSLLVAILQTLEQLARRRRRDVVTLVVQCIVMCFRAWLEYFNSFAFCYVGLCTYGYICVLVQRRPTHQASLSSAHSPSVCLARAFPTDGYDYLSAGRNVVTLFKQRGWTTFISDRLIFRVLFLANLGVAALTGGLCAIGAWIMGGGQEGGLGAFWLGFLIGLYVSSTILFVVESAARTVMVCFAESASEFQEVHGELYEEMKGGWSESYPDAWNGTPAVAVVATPMV